MKRTSSIRSSGRIKANNQAGRIDSPMLNISAGPIGQKNSLKKLNFDGYEDDGFIINPPDLQKGDSKKQRTSFTGLQSNNFDRQNMSGSGLNAFKTGSLIPSLSGIFNNANNSSFANRYLNEMPDMGLMKTRSRGGGQSLVQISDVP